MIFGILAIVLILTVISVIAYCFYTCFYASNKTPQEIAEITETAKSEAESQALAKMWRNKAISDTYYPGSVFKMITLSMALEEGTVDEKITSLLESKQAIFDAFADKSVAASESKELDDTTFGNIIKEEIDRINAKRGAQMPSTLS